MIFRIIVSSEAKVDIAELKVYIKQQLKMPETAAKYIREMMEAIRNLALYADLIGQNEYIQAMFGANARHIVFKKMTIIYMVENDVVYIKRVIPGALIY